MMKLDIYDLNLLDALQQDGRASITDLARRINLSATPCAQRLRKLEASGVIASYRALIDPRRLGLDLLVFIEVTLKETGEQTLQAFNAAIRAVPHILECHMVGGNFDYLLKARVADMPQYRALLGSEIGSLPMVQSTHSYFVMEEVKDMGPLPLKPVRTAGKR
jgi:Lrp/AsnC family leucine-responsive transcriptional regulator